MFAFTAVQITFATVGTTNLVRLEALVLDVAPFAVNQEIHTLHTALLTFGVVQKSGNDEFVFKADVISLPGHLLKAS